MNDNTIRQDANRETVEVNDDLMELLGISGILDNINGESI